MEFAYKDITIRKPHEDTYIVSSEYIFINEENRIWFILH